MHLEFKNSIYLSQKLKQQIAKARENTIHMFHNAAI